MMAAVAKKNYTKNERIEALEKRVEALEVAVTQERSLENVLNKIELLNAVVAKAELLSAVVAKADVIENIIKRVETLEPVLAKLFSLEGRPIELEAPHRGDPSGSGDIDVIKNRLESLVSRVETIEKLPNEINETQKSFGEALDGVTEDAREVIQSLRLELQTVKGKVEELTNAGGVGVMPMGRTKIPEPTPFKGARDSSIVDNFLFDMELYFGAMKIDGDEQRLRIAPMYLAEDAKLWWRTKVEGINAGRFFINGWDDFKQELRDQFYPENVGFNTRAQLDELKHTGSIRDYVRQFSALILNVPDMAEVDRVHRFLTGLKPWAKKELQRQGVKDVKTAISAAESFDIF